mgnify:CR=1 FL=1
MGFPKSEKRKRFSTRPLPYIMQDMITMKLSKDENRLHIGSAGDAMLIE